MLNGQYYYFECMNADVEGIYPAIKFKDDAEAIRIAADYEATVYKKEYKDGELMNSNIIYDPSEF